MGGQNKEEKNTHVFSFRLAFEMNKINERGCEKKMKGRKQKQA